MLPRKLDGRTSEKGEWTQVRGRKNNHNSRKVISSYYVTNIPDGTSRFILKEVFKPFGRISDVYIPGRKDKGGTFFGFVKFEGVLDEVKLEKSMQRVKCGQCILKVSISKYQKQDKKKIFTSNDRFGDPPTYPPPTHPSSRQPQNVRGASRDGRTFSEAVSAPLRSGLQPPSTVALKHVLAMVGWNDCALVGEVTSLHLLTELPKLVEAECSFSKKLFYAGGMRIVLRFDLPKEAENFLREEHTWNRWFKWLRLGVFDEPNIERIAWVKITGVPISLRAEENYTIIANIFGNTIQADGQNWQNLDLSYGTACILTSSLTRINSHTIGTFNNKSYNVGIVEYDYNWHPFFHNTATPQDESDMEEDEEMNEQSNHEEEDDFSNNDSEEEGISDTWDNQDTEELEEGEINQHEAPEDLNLIGKEFVDGGDAVVTKLGTTCIGISKTTLNVGDASTPSVQIFNHEVGNTDVIGGDTYLHISNMVGTTGLPSPNFGTTHLKSLGPHIIKPDSNVVSTPSNKNPNHIDPIPDFEMGDSIGKRRKVDRSFASLITPHRIFDPPLGDSSQPIGDTIPIQCPSKSTLFSLDLNKPISISDSSICSISTEVRSSNNEIDSTIRIGNEVGTKLMSNL
ncbi:unnamed protein product [Lactuca virosa]|uniref:RRM domain-containing protein n=1 Tax=Lactuca virosa TaxID=75947 RepID=A0AAU9NRR6_9ASTR|nr:unnamed protein product [Lactuca virosa]